MQLTETLNYIFAEIIMIKQLCFVNKRPTGLDGHLNAIAFKSTCLHLKLYFTCSLDPNSRFLRLFSPTFILVVCKQQIHLKIMWKGARVRGVSDYL